MKKGFYEFKKELLQQINAEIENAPQQSITVEEFEEYLNIHNKVTKCVDTIGLLKLAQTFYRTRLFSVCSTPDSPTTSSIEYYLGKLQEVRRELYG